MNLGFRTCSTNQWWTRFSLYINSFLLFVFFSYYYYYYYIIILLLLLICVSTLTGFMCAIIAFTVFFLLWPTLVSLKEMCFIIYPLVLCNYNFFSFGHFTILTLESRTHTHTSLFGLIRRQWVEKIPSSTINSENVQNLVCVLPEKRPTHYPYLIILILIFMNNIYIFILNIFSTLFCSFVNSFNTVTVKTSSLFCLSFIYIFPSKKKSGNIISFSLHSICESLVWCVYLNCL